jgi:Ca2+-transporting ATPase
MDTETKQLHYYRLSADEVLTQLRTKAEGLTSKEAGERLRQGGGNILQRAKREVPLVTFFRQFKNLLVLMLLTSAVFSLYLKDGKTATILIGIALMNASVGFFQEH